METQTKNIKGNANWYVTLMERFSKITDEENINEKSASTIKAFLLAVAREQYMAGNKNGIRWARTNP